MKLRHPGRVVAVVLAAALALLVVRHERSQDTALNAPAASLAGFSVEYRVETRAGGTRTETRNVQVRRPFDGRDASFDPTLSLGNSAFVSNGRHLYSQTGTSALDYGERIGAPPGDYRLEAIAGDLVRLGLARARGTRTVAGRVCRVYRTGAPLGDPFKGATAKEYADLCVGKDGLLLAERWYLNGKLLRDTEATSVDTSVPGDAAFAPPVGDLTANPTSFGAVKELSLTKPPNTGLPYWTARRPPWGFALRSRARTITSSTTSGSPQVTDIAYVDTYQRGHDAITVTHRELSAAGAPPRGVEQVDAGALGAGQVTLTTSGAAIAFRAGKWVVTVQGPFDVAHLRFFAASLRRVG
ncbi:MAG TPA: hypothetical protein VHC63_08250 [Acidimicrobiales bacterium]|nr:hypothetical protein [Acidimicrobiales bacterium]